MPLQIDPRQTRPEIMKAAIIGTGNIAREHLGALGELPTVQTVGVCDLSATLAEATADRFDVPAFYTDYREMLERAQPDAVHIATPPPTHFRLAVVPTADCDRATFPQTVTGRFTELFGDEVTVDVSFVEKIDRTAAGKHCVMLSMLRQAKLGLLPDTPDR